MSEQKKTLSKREQILILKGQGFGPLKISHKLHLPLSTVKYHYFPKVREKMREYMREYQQRPEVREKMREYKRRRMFLIDTFTDFETGYTLKDLQEKVGDLPSRLKIDLNLYVQSGVLIMTIENGIEVYRLNPNSPLHKAVDGYFKSEERKLFRKG